VRRIAPDGPLKQVIRPSAPLISADPFNWFRPSADPAAANTNLMGRHCNHKSHLVAQVTAAAHPIRKKMIPPTQWMPFESKLATAVSPPHSSSLSRSVRLFDRVGINIQAEQSGQPDR
jgi:hypothetical protein